MAKKKPKAKDPAKPSRDAIATGAALAVLLERDAGTVSRYQARDDWPFGPPPWPADRLPLIRQWVADVVDGRGAAHVPAVRAARVTLLRAQVEALDLEHAIATGALAPRADLVRGLAGAAATARAAFLTLPDRLADRLTGAEGDVREALKSAVENICDELETTLSKVTQAQGRAEVDPIVDDEEGEDDGPDPDRAAPGR